MSRFILSLVVAAAIAEPSIVAGHGRAARPGDALGGLEQPRSTSDYLAVIVNLSNPVENLPLNDLRAMALLQQTNWPNGRKITLALHEPGPLERQAVLQLVYHMNESAFSRYFLQATFTGRIGSGPRLLSTSENVKRFVVNVPGALGFVRLADVDASVKTVRVDGRVAGSPDYALILPHDSHP